MGCMAENREGRLVAEGLAGRWRVAGPVLIALAATAAVLATLGPQGDGPGVTCDELYHVAVGKRLVTALGQQGFGFFDGENVKRNFHWEPDGPPVHPPLGNWVLGWTHYLFDPAPDDPNVVSIAAARFAPALAFGLLVGLVGLAVVRSDGPLAGSVAAAAVALVPRVFGHAHLAALDTLTALCFVAAVLAVIEADRRGRRLWLFAVAGVVWGLAMLVRMHGLLILPPVVVWLVWRLGLRPWPFRWRAALPVLVWGASGAATFLLGWPWLWYSMVAHFKQYLGTATGRAALHVYYAGRAWDDCDAPWHYPLVMFAVTVPLGLLVLGLAGAWAKRRGWRADPGYLLVMGTLVWVLAVFAWPGTPVYDGVRLFLMVFPLWAVSVGAGARWAVEHPAWRSVSPRLRVAALAVFLALQGVGLAVHHPCQLSHYSLLSGGLAGAEKLGFEVTYWGDTVREPLLAEAARWSPGRPLLFGPNLAPFQAPAVAISSPALVEGEVSVVGWDPARAQDAAECRLAVVYHRKADLDRVEPLLRDGVVVAEYRHQGVWLARLVQLPAPAKRLVDGEHRPKGAGRSNPSGNGPRRAAVRH